MKFLQASAVLAAIAIPSVTAVSRASLQGKASPKVAIVDATYISTASKWAKVNYLDKIDKESRGYESQLQKIGLDIERLKRDQVWLKAKSHKWNLKQVEVETLGHRRQLLGRTYRLWLDSEMNSASRAIYERIANAVKLVCEKQGIDLVLKKRGTRNSSNPNIKDAVRLDQVIYANSALDITDDVLKLVDNADVGTGNATSTTGRDGPGASGAGKKDGK